MEESRIKIGGRLVVRRQESGGKVSIVLDTMKQGRTVSAVALPPADALKLAEAVQSLAGDAFASQLVEALGERAKESCGG